jgi:hypothetical protein
VLVPVLLNTLFRASVHRIQPNETIFQLIKLNSQMPHQKDD